MRLHVGSKHTGEEYVKRKAACATCGKSFRCPADLRAHAVVHTKEKPFKCGLCSATFSQKATLKGKPAWPGLVDDGAGGGLGVHACLFVHCAFLHCVSKQRSKSPGR